MVTKIYNLNSEKLIISKRGISMKKRVWRIRKLKKKEEHEIIDEKTWFDYAPPEGGEKQWVPLHSALEFAKYCTKNYNHVPHEINKILDDLKIDSVSFEAEPEATTSLAKDGFGKAGPRHHDLLMWKDNEIVVGIEAKATETLDKYVTDVFASLKAKNKNNQLTDNQEKRYPGLCERILGMKLEDCCNIRYQLLSATAGTLIEAKRHHTNKAAVIVILFESCLTTEEHIKETEQDIKVFETAFKKRKQNIKDNNINKELLEPEIEVSFHFVRVDACHFDITYK